MIRIYILIIVLLLHATYPSKGMAQYYGGMCFEPNEPHCLNTFSGLDEYNFDNCRRNVQNYVSGMENYIQCLKNEIEEKIDEVESMRYEQKNANNDINNVIEKFNCLADGRSFC